MPLPKIIKDIYWKMPFLLAEQKETFFYEAKKIILNEGVTTFAHGSGLAENISNRFSLFLRQKVRNSKRLLTLLINVRMEIQSLLRIIFHRCIQHLRMMLGGGVESLNGTMYLVLYRSI